MTVKEILIDAAGMAGRQDLASFLESGVGADAKAMEYERDALVRCYNLTEAEMALDYRPLRHTESLPSESGYVAYSAFSKRPLKVEKVTRGGVPVPFTEGIAGLETAKGNLQISYRFAPERKSAEDVSDYTEREARALALGTACEYSLASGLYEQALTWDKRYKGALAALCRGRCGTLKMRRWV